MLPKTLNYSSLTTLLNYKLIMAELNMCTFNVKGLVSRSKRLRIFEWLKQQHFNTCILQELHCKKENVTEWKTQWGGDVYLSGDSSNSRGVGIFY